MEPARWLDAINKRTRKLENPLHFPLVIRWMAAGLERLGCGSSVRRCALGSHLILHEIILSPANMFLGVIGDMSLVPSNPEAVAATAPGESGWSLQALVATFADRFPRWLRKMGVPDACIEDAAQDVFVEVLRELHTIPGDPERAREELIRLASRVASRWKRAAQRGELYDSDIDVADTRNVLAI